MTDSGPVAGAREVAQRLSPTALERIYFARFSVQELASQAEGRSYWLLPLFGSLILCTVVGRRLFLPQGEPLFLLLLGAAAVIAITSEIRRQRQFRALRGQIRDHADPRARLICIADPQVLCQEGPLDDVPFEPAIFPATFAVPRPRELTRLAWVIGIVAFAVLMLVTRSLQIRESMLVVSVAGALAELTVALYRPVALRIVPGRLDFLRFSAFGRRALQVEAFDLKTAQIYVDLRTLRSVVRQDERQLPLNLTWFWRRREFARVIFLAAISSYTPAPLPADELAG